jgi:hypothetical protein
MGDTLKLEKLVAGAFADSDKLVLLLYEPTFFSGEV